MDYRAFYDLDSYLFGPVRQRFLSDAHLSAFDFFCIVTWKAARAKPRVAERLLAKGHASLDEAVRALTAAVAAAATPKEKLRVLVQDWGFRLPMATAVLTVLYPDDFTICDVRVAEEIGQPVPEGYGRFDVLWDRYVAFRFAVEAAAPAGLSLRAKDEYLWGRSVHRQLAADLEGWRLASVGLPERFSVSIGGFGGPCYRAELAAGALRYSCAGLYRDHAQDEEIRPTRPRWAAFWSACERLNVWSWDERYEDCCVLDGTSWEVDIQVGDRRVQASGSNAYPGATPDTDPAEPTPVFRRFLAALRQLLDGRPFA